MDLYKCHYIIVACNYDTDVISSWQGSTVSLRVTDSHYLWATSSDCNAWRIINIYGKIMFWWFNMIINLCSKCQYTDVQEWKVDRGCFEAAQACLFSRESLRLLTNYDKWGLVLVNGGDQVGCKKGNRSTQSLLLLLFNAAVSAGQLIAAPHCWSWSLSDGIKSSQYT